MIQNLTAGVTAVIGWFGDVVTALFGESGSWAALAPIVGVAVGIGIAFTAVRIIKSIVVGYN